MRGHTDLRIMLWIWAALALVGVEAFFRYRDGRSLFAEYWVEIAIGVGARLVLIVVLVAGWRWYTRPRMRDWWTSGSFGQPVVRYMALSRGGNLVYEGLYSDGERLLAAFRAA